MTRTRNVHLTFRANVGAGRHGWLRLTPAYSVALVRDHVARLPEGAVVTDPFSGTGTTPLAAAEHGHLGQSVDLNPFLVWLGRVKTAHYDDGLLEKAAAALPDLLAAARSGLGRELWQPRIFRIERWWSAGPLAALRALRHAVDVASVGAEAADLYAVALCRTLLATSNAAFNHQSMSFRDAASARHGEVGPQGRGSGSAAAPGAAPDPAETAPVFAKFAAEVQALVADAGFDLAGSARIIHGDARALPAELEPCDLLLTSPPYVNRMSYIRELRPYMYWLRYLDVAADAGELDWRAIGGTWGAATSRLATWAPSRTGTPVDGPMDEVRARIAADGGKNGPLLSNYVGKYFHDIWDHFGSARGHVKPGGRVSYIVGNSAFYGHIVPAEQWYAAMLRALGFERVRIETIRKRNSNRHLFEYAVTAVRP